MRTRPPKDRRPAAGDVKPAEKKKRGRPKGKPLSPKERAQRATAALKTGEHSQRLLGKILPPCKPSVCPDQYPCQVKEGIEGRGGGLAVCLQQLGHGDTVDAFRRAIGTGDTKAAGEIAALSLGAYSALEQSELVLLLGEGLTVDRPIFGRGEDGEPVELGSIAVENPRVDKLLRISDLLGHTAKQQVVTPHSRGEKAASEGISQLGQAAWIATMRRGLTGEEEG
jgi:hypothetical protein